jgi:CheY-like chemotaxis protein
MTDDFPEGHGVLESYHAADGFRTRMTVWYDGSCRTVFRAGTRAAKCLLRRPMNFWHPNWNALGVTTSGDRRSILVVEDAVAVRNMLEDFLNLYGYDVLVASHPDTAFKRLKHSAATLDAMILDIGLDDNRSGIEVLEMMRLDDRFVDLPVIVLTGLNLTEDQQESIRRNRALLLHKKDGYEAVFSRLADIIGRLASQRRLRQKESA